MPALDFSRLRTEITMEQVLTLLEFKPTSRRGDQWYGHCPLHESTANHRRAFSVNISLGCFYCHTCKRKGNQLTLWAAATNLPLYEATILLCRELGREVLWRHRR